MEHFRSPLHMSLQRANRSYLHLTALHQLNEVSEKDVSIPLAETFRIIRHLEERHRDDLIIRNCPGSVKDGTCVQIRTVNDIRTKISGLNFIGKKING